MHLVCCNFSVVFDRHLQNCVFDEEAVSTLSAKLILEIAICSFMHMTVLGNDKDENEPQNIRHRSDRILTNR